MRSNKNNKILKKITKMNKFFIFYYLIALQMSDKMLISASHHILHGYLLVFSFFLEISPHSIFLRSKINNKKIYYKKTNFEFTFFNQKNLITFIIFLIKNLISNNFPQLKEIRQMKQGFFPQMAENRKTSNKVYFFFQFFFLEFT